MKRLLLPVVVLLLAGAAHAQPWSTGTITYDGSGNIKTMGADTYVYDELGRLVKSYNGSDFNHHKGESKRSSRNARREATAEDSV